MGYSPEGHKELGVINDWAHELLTAGASFVVEHRP